MTDELKPRQLFSPILNNRISIIQWELLSFVPNTIVIIRKIEQSKWEKARQVKSVEYNEFRKSYIKV